MGTLLVRIGFPHSPNITTQWGNNSLWPNFLHLMGGRFLYLNGATSHVAFKYGSVDVVNEESMIESKIRPIID